MWLILAQRAAGADERVLRRRDGASAAVRALRQARRAGDLANRARQTGRFAEVRLIVTNRTLLRSEKASAQASSKRVSNRARCLSLDRSERAWTAQRALLRTLTVDLLAGNG